MMRYEYQLLASTASAIWREVIMFIRIGFRRMISGICLALALWCVVAPLFESLAAAAQAKRALELKDYYRIESAGSPAISPDGQWVAFVRTYIVEAENRRNSEIWLAPSD